MINDMHCPNLHFSRHRYKRDNFNSELCMRRWELVQEMYSPGEAEDGEEMNPCLGCDIPIWRLFDNIVAEVSAERRLGR